MPETTPPRPLRAGVIGLGMGRTHIPQYQADAACTVTAICDMDRDKLAAIAAQHGVEHTFTDPQELIDSGLCDLVSVATPNRFHAPLTHAALDAGLHVLCEKPMAMNAADAGRMVDAAARADRKLAIHFNHRMNPSIFAMRTLVETGDLGDIYFARTFWHRRRGIPARPSFLSMENAGGGAMIDLGVHMLDQTLFVIGYPNVLSVSAQTYTKFHEVDVPDLPMDVDDFAVALLRLEGGGTLEMEISWASHHEHAEQTLVQVYGTQGGVRRVVEDYKEAAFTLHHRQRDALLTSHIVKPPRGKAPTVQQDLLDAIRQNRTPLCSGDHGRSTMQILDAIYESSRAGKEVRLDGGE